MPGKRRVLGMMVGTARMIGVLLVVLAVLSLPEVRFLTKHLRESLNTLCSLTLALVGIVWLVAVECFLRFFDQFLSRN